jgi:hypothetical protein
MRFPSSMMSNHFRPSLSAIRYVRPDERHYGIERAILERRRDLYERVRQSNRERWTQTTRNGAPVGVVALNPEHAPSSPAE